MRTTRLLVTFVVCLAITASAHAVINPKLQPSHLADRYLNLIACSVTAIDPDARTAVLELEGVAKGDFAAKEITLTAKDKGLADAILILSKGQKVVAFVGKRRVRHENDILYYVGSGVWYLATMSDSPGKWEVLSNADKGLDPSSSEIMFGTFNGEPESLWELLEDITKGVAYFPAVPLTRFSVTNVAGLEKPVRGVAVYDVTGDGRCDLLACCEAGNRLFIQDDKGQFVDRTEQAGLPGTKSVSCSFAAFFEYNGDGYPDVVVSREDEGLALYVNPGQSGGAFADKTEDAGLTNESNGEGMTGYFETCDWDLDGRGDLIFVSGPGLLLWQNGSGEFEPFDIADQDSDYAGGTAAFGMIVRPGVSSAYLVAGHQKTLVCENSGNLADVTRSGNEIQDPVSGMLMALAEDLNCDGTVDLYAASYGRQSHTARCIQPANLGHGDGRR